MPFGCYSSQQDRSYIWDLDFQIDWYLLPDSRLTAIPAAMIALYILTILILEHRRRSLVGFRNYSWYRIQLAKASYYA